MDPEPNPRSEPAFEVGMGEVVWALSARAGKAGIQL
jgi:hypothetical protein